MSTLLVNIRQLQYKRAVQTKNTLIGCVSFCNSGRLTQSGRAL